MEVLGSDPGYDTTATAEITRQLDYYAKYSAIKNYQGNDKGWWLRSATSNTMMNFYYVKNSGTTAAATAITAYGISPSFRLAN